MKERDYEHTLSEVITQINEGVSLMTYKEELDYKKRIVKDLKEWLRLFIR